MTPETIRTAVEALCRQVFGEGGFEQLAVTVGRDHAAEPAVFINVKVKGTIDASLERKISDVKLRIFSFFREQGDERFPYVWIAFDDPTGIAMDDKVGSRRRRAR